eukprot:TRINITY_DN21794_c0_g1_i1.p1 TRINITY_DN21794_c0_g1~~TRINITY_DN21794_c0_g1_i1.p1  ORF type:complete len:566 (-),score=88.80 TRINITY_DN21794_c0_g1_i1:26-1723(-)
MDPYYVAPGFKYSSKVHSLHKSGTHLLSLAQELSDLRRGNRDLRRRLGGLESNGYSGVISDTNSDVTTLSPSISTTTILSTQDSECPSLVPHNHHSKLRNRDKVNHSGQKTKEKTGNKDEVVQALEELRQRIGSIEARLPHQSTDVGPDTSPQAHAFAKRRPDEATGDSVIFRSADLRHSADTAEASQELAFLRRHVNLLEERNQRLSAELDAERSAAEEQLQSAAESLRAQLALAKADSDAAHAHSEELIAVKRQADQLRTECERRERDRVALQSTLDRALASERQAHERICDLEKQLTVLQAQTAEAAGAREAELLLAEEVATLRDKAALLVSVETRASETQSRLEAQLAESERIFHEAQSKMLAVTNESQQLRELIIQLTAERDAAQSEANKVPRLLEQIEELKESRGRVETELADTKNELCRVQQIAELREHRIQELEVRKRGPVHESTESDSLTAVELLQAENADLRARLAAAPHPHDLGVLVDQIRSIQHRTAVSPSSVASPEELSVPSSTAVASVPARYSHQGEDSEKESDGGEHPEVVGDPSPPTTPRDGEDDGTVC